MTQFAFWKNVRQKPVDDRGHDDILHSNVRNLVQVRLNFACADPVSKKSKLVAKTGLN